MVANSWIQNEGLICVPVGIPLLWKQASQTRTGARPQPLSGTGRVFEEQESQKPSPQARQWCLVSLGWNSSPHLWHFCNTHNEDDTWLYYQLSHCRYSSIKYKILEMCLHFMMMKHNVELTVWVSTVCLSIDWPLVHKVSKKPLVLMVVWSLSLTHLFSYSPHYCCFWATNVSLKNNTFLLKKTLFFVKLPTDSAGSAMSLLQMAVTEVKILHPGQYDWTVYQVELLWKVYTTLHALIVLFLSLVLTIQLSVLYFFYF